MQTDVERYAHSQQLAAAGKPEEAYLLLLELVSRGTALFEPYLEAGRFALDRGNLDTALGLLRMAAQREVDTAEATLGLAKIHLAQGRPAEALAVWSRKLAKSCSAQVTRGFSRFVAEWDGPDEDLENFFKDLVRGPEFRYSDYCPVARQGALKNRTQVFPPEELPRTAVRFHNMLPAPNPAASFPAVNHHEFGPAIVRSHSDVVITGGCGVIPDFIKLEEHLLYDTFTGRTMPLAGGEVFAIPKDSVRSHLAAGILLTSYAVTNWAHFLTEILPIAALAEELALPTEYALVLGKPAAAQMMECLELVKSPGRAVTIITQATQVERAIWFSPVATTPFEYLKARCGQTPNYAPADTLFSPGALAALRRRLPLGTASEGLRAGTKVYIDRNSARRRVTNRKEVLAFFQEAGFEIVVPEALSLSQQMSLFAGASVIVGQSGAGLANMLFAPAGTRILVLSGNPADPGPHAYFPNLARALGHELHYLAFGPPSQELHIDFQVDLKVLETFRDWLT